MAHPLLPSLRLTIPAHDHHHAAQSKPIPLLIVGGAGQIGSHMVRHLRRQSCDIVAFDNLSTGHCDAVLGGIAMGNPANRNTLDALETIIEDARKLGEGASDSPIHRPATRKAPCNLARTRLRDANWLI